MAANASALFNVAELFEKVLLKLDHKTLLLAQSVNTHWSATIQGSKKVQQRLCKVPVTTIEEVRRLDLVQPEDIVLLDCCDTGELLAVLNTNVVECAVPQEEISQCYQLKLVKNILPYTISANRGVGSWESMFFCQPSTFPSDTHLCCLDVGAVMGIDIATPKFDYIDYDGYRRASGERPGCGVETHTNMRGILDVVEKESQQDHGYTVNWGSSKLYFGAHAMRYCDYLESFEGEDSESESEDSGSDECDGSDGDEGNANAIEVGGVEEHV